MISSAWGTAPARFPTPHPQPSFWGSGGVENTSETPEWYRASHPTVQWLKQSPRRQETHLQFPPLPQSLDHLRWSHPREPSKAVVLEDADLVWTTQISPHALAGQLNREQPYKVLQSPGTCASPRQTHSSNSELNFTTRLLITDFLIKRQQTRH